MNGFYNCNRKGLEPSEFGKKTGSKKMLSYMKIMTAKHKLRRQKYAVIYQAYDIKTWLIGKTSVRIATYK